QKIAWCLKIPKWVFRRRPPRECLRYEFRRPRNASLSPEFRQRSQSSCAGGTDAGTRAALALVEFAIGGLKQVLHAPAIVGENADADADAESRLFPAGAERVFDAARDLTGHARIAIDKQHCKFIASIARREIRGAALFLHHFGEPFQRAIAGEMAEAIVDHFQIIKIEQNHSERAIAAFAAADFAFERIEEFAIVGQAGERVVCGLVMDYFFVLLALGDVEPGADAADDFSRRGAQRFKVQFERTTVALVLELR